MWKLGKSFCPRSLEALERWFMELMPLQHDPLRCSTAQVANLYHL